MTVVKKVLAIYRPFWKSLTAIALLIMVQKVGDLLVPFFGGRVIDAMAQHRTLDAINLLIATSFIFWVCHGNILPYVLGWVDIARFRYPAPKRIGVNNLRIIAARPPADAGKDRPPADAGKDRPPADAGKDRPPADDAGKDTAMQQAVIERGEQVLMDFMNSLVRVAIPISIPGIVTLGLLLWWYPLIGIIAVVGGALDVLVTLYLNKALKPFYARLQTLDYERRRLLTRFFRDLGQSPETQQKQERIAEYDARYGEFATFGITTGKRFIGFHFGRGLVVNVTNVSTWIVGAWYVDAGTYSLGYFLASLSWSAYVLNVIGAGIDLQKQWMETMPAIKAFFVEIETGGTGPAAAQAAAGPAPGDIDAPIDAPVPILAAQ